MQPNNQDLKLLMARDEQLFCSIRAADDAGIVLELRRYEVCVSTKLAKVLGFFRGLAYATADDNEIGSKQEFNAIKIFLNTVCLFIPFQVILFSRTVSSIMLGRPAMHFYMTKLSIGH